MFPAVADGQSLAVSVSAVDEPQAQSVPETEEQHQLELSVHPSLRYTVESIPHWKSAQPQWLPSSVTVSSRVVELNSVSAVSQ